MIGLFCKTTVLSALEFDKLLQDDTEVEDSNEVDTKHPVLWYPLITLHTSLWVDADIVEKVEDKLFVEASCPNVEIAIETGKSCVLACRYTIVAVVDGRLFKLLAAATAASAASTVAVDIVWQVVGHVLIGML